LPRQFRKDTKAKTVFPSDNSLEKVLYLASLNIMKNGLKGIKQGSGIIPAPYNLW